MTRLLLPADTAAHALPASATDPGEPNEVEEFPDCELEIPVYEPWPE